MSKKNKKWTLVYNKYFLQTRGAHNRFYIRFHIEPDGMGEYMWNAWDSALSNSRMTGNCKTPLEAKKEAISAYKLLKSTARLQEVKK